MQEIALASPFKELWADKEPFEEAFRLDGESFRQVKSRHTFRFEIGGKGYFAKLHHGCGWHEIFKDLFQFKRPILGADNEYRALLHLKKQNIDTMTPCAYGMRGSNPAHLQSFLITRELTGVVSLEDLCLNWQENPPAFSVKAALIRKLGTMTGRMHRSGLNHRDCYICHFLLKKDTLVSSDPTLHVIDLHRAQIRAKVPHRYLVKDVAGLFFSSMDTGITSRDILRFIRAYADRPLRQELAENRRFYEDVKKAARKLYRKEFSKEAPL